MDAADALYTPHCCAAFNGKKFLPRHACHGLWVQLVSLRLRGSMLEGPPASVAHMAGLESLDLTSTGVLAALPAGPYRQSVRQLELGERDVAQPR